MKKCKVCLEQKDLSLFDKYRSTCRKCRNKKNTSSYLSKEGNIEYRREYMRVYMSDKYKNSDDYKIYNKILRNIRVLFNNNKFKSEFELKFTGDMNWDNYGTYWEIDHIFPALKMIRLGYNIDEINDIKNIRPLRISENRSRIKSEIS